MASQLETAANAMPTTTVVSMPLARSLGTLSTAAAAITGMDIRKLKTAADWRSKDRKRAAVIVAPERDTPGTSATAWAKPIIRACRHVMSDSARVVADARSAHQSSAPNTMRVVAVSAGA